MSKKKRLSLSGQRFYYATELLDVTSRNEYQVQGFSLVSNWREKRRKSSYII